MAQQGPDISSVSRIRDGEETCLDQLPHIDSQSTRLYKAGRTGKEEGHQRSTTSDSIFPIDHWLLKLQESEDPFHRGVYPQDQRFWGRLVNSAELGFIGHD